MAWISFFFLCLSLRAAELPKFLTKHSPETLRFISLDGRYAYVQKRPGVLGLVTSFKSTDFLSDSTSSDFIMRSSRFRSRIAIEAIPNAHDEMSLLKNHRLLVIDFGNSSPREIGTGVAAKLHLGDEWLTYYNVITKVIHIENLVTQKRFEIKLSKKMNPFFVPEIEMVSSKVIVYSDINDQGFAALVSYNLEDLRSNIIHKSSQSATRIELCQSESYLAVGEFPYEGVSRGSKIQMVKLGQVVNLSGLEGLYQSVEQDIGNMVCLPHSIYFVKTMNQDKVLNHRTTEAVKLDIKTQNIEARSNLKHVGQIIEMDGRVMIPSRGDFYVLEGQANLAEDILRSVPSKQELQIDL